jgi:hypothetical protein
MRPFSFNNLNFLKKYDIIFIESEGERNMKYTKREQRATAENFVSKRILKEHIKPGFRFYIRKDDCGGKLWFEVVDFEYDWRFQEDMPVVWNEHQQNFEKWPLNQIVSAGYID